MPRPLIALFAGIGWLAVGTQFVLSIRTGIANGNGVLGGVVSYFGYFTLLTNILCAAVLTAHARAGVSADHRASGGLGAFLRRPGVATTGATAIIIVGVVYHLILAAQWNPQGIDLVVDTLLHTLNPILFVLFWWRAVPRGAIALTEIPLWTSYPAGYALYVFARGEILNEYPYPFIDVAAIGYGAALRNSGVVALVFFALAALLVGVNRVAGPLPPEH